MHDNEITIAEVTGSDVGSTWSVMRQLRPNLSESDYVARVDRMRQTDHFQLVAVYRGRQIVAVAGFRSMEMLYCGRILSVDDLIVDQAVRSQQLGRLLVGWLRERARQLGCAQVHLDSRFIREDAHRFYDREGFEKLGYHFVLDLGLQ